MRFGFELQVSLLSIGAVILLRCPLDIDRVRVVPFDQVAVIAINRPDEISERRDDPFR